MKRPKQLPAVDRSTSKTAAVPAGANVNPSGSLWDTIRNMMPQVPQEMNGFGGPF
jgi:hypothetical protein